jgi:uncharacterized membrane protein HdeD (DUF308 family)
MVNTFSGDSMADVVIAETKVTVVDEQLKNVRYGWYVVFGIVAIIFGGLGLIYPAIFTAFMVVFTAALLMLFGLYGFITGFFQPAGQKLVPIILGLIGFLIGLAGIVYPAIFGVSLVVILGILILIIGGLMIVFSIVEKELAHRWLLFLLGIISVIFAILFFIYPIYAAVGVAVLLAIYFIIIGLVSIYTGFKIRSLKKLAFG